jgi:hypothetical protein
MRAVFGLNDSKAIGNANHLHIEKFTGLRDGGRAGLSALRTPEILNPIVAFRHLPNMRPESGVFQSGALQQTGGSQFEISAFCPHNIGHVHNFIQEAQRPSQGLRQASCGMAHEETMKCPMTTQTGTASKPRNAVSRHRRR